MSALTTVAYGLSAAVKLADKGLIGDTAVKLADTIQTHLLANAEDQARAKAIALHASLGIIAVVAAVVIAGLVALI